ncbi:uncharacterized protein LOC134846121 [Symsagittifera roscoffensis]|uniref:uncharacterized protein LOC134846121 n=1 Tax=Symsagittifera roscoffensis TaxID=84072 RepID=UPI00307C6265
MKYLIITIVLLTSLLQIQQLEAFSAEMKEVYPYPKAYIQQDGSYCVIVRYEISPPLLAQNTKFIEFLQDGGGECAFICKESCPIQASTCADHLNLDIQDKLVFFMKNVTRDNVDFWAGRWQLSVQNYMNNQRAATTLQLPTNILQLADLENEEFPFVNFQCG